MAGNIAVTGGFSQLLNKDYTEIFNDSYLRHEEEFSKIAKMETGDSNYIKKGEITGLGALQEVAEGGATPYEAPEQGNDKTVYFTNYALGFQITQNMWDDDLTGNMRDMPRELAKSVRYTEEVEYFDILNNSNNTTYRSGIDGKALCANNHPTIDGSTTIDNKGTASLSQTALEASLDYFDGLVNEKNIPIKKIPKYLVIPYQLRWVAKEILQSDYKPYTGDNEINTLRDSGLQVVIGHFLTSSVYWWVLADDHDLCFLRRKPTEFKSMDDFNTGNALFKATTRFATDFWNYRGVYGSFPS
jgi:hypothetical protein